VNNIPSLDLLIRRTAAWQSLREIRRRLEVWQWERTGKPIPPPPLVKRSIVKSYGARFGLNVLIETGTYRGDMINACRQAFDYMYSIELDDMLFAEAARRFARYAHISILHGDSGSVLPDLLRTIAVPSLFWLDGHYCASVSAKGRVETPIASELEAILRHRVSGHVVLIDDARCFTGKNDYPTIDQLRSKVLAHHPDWALEVATDIIRIHHKDAPV
jgi:hypothetical protein